MDKNLFESLVINCLKHGDFSVSKDVYERKEENKTSDICPKCLKDHRSCLRPPTTYDTKERQSLPMIESAKIAARALPSRRARSTAPPQLLPTADSLRHPRACR